MNKTGKIAIGTLAATGLVVASIAMAHNPGNGYGPGMMGHGMMGSGMGGPGMMGQGMTGDHVAFMTEHLNTVKEQLKLTAGQTDAWQAFETAVLSQAASMSAMHQQHGTMTHENMQQHIAFMEARVAGMKTVLQAHDDLYAVLTPEQKATADNLMQQHAHFGHAK